jgi:citrate lyase subunit beta/citryl-CoA lyase
MAAPHSYLFVPADRPERFDKALNSGADAIIIDLEDAVAPAAKDAARPALVNWLAAHSEPLQKVWIRVNAAGTAWHEADVALAAGSAVAGIVLPKAERPEEVHAVIARLTSDQQLLPIIESAVGLQWMREIAVLDKVQRLMFGSLDLQLDLGMQCDADETELAHFRMELVLASRLAGIAPPVDGVCVGLDDEAALASAVARAKRMGFRAKLCIHPRQLAVVNQGFLPALEELVWARKIVAAVSESGGAAISVDGKMVDAPVIALAQRLLAETQRPA